MPTERETRPGPAFALAKIQPPRPRSGLICRPTLERSLGQALHHHPITLLQAPAGYGKTAALARQLPLLPADMARVWISADADDGLPRFLACLAAALEPHDPAWRVSPEALTTLAASDGGLGGVAAACINALAGARAPAGLLVIDDAHRITDPRVFELLAAVIERLPLQWHVAIASRVAPPLPLARWRASGLLAELREPDLRFDAADLDALLAAVGADPQQGPALLARTAGWPAGIRLGLGTRHGADAGAVGGQRHLFDYLAAEVLDDMPPALRAFLLRCAVLPELTASRCAQVSGAADAARLLDEVARRGLFVTVLDADEPTLRQHDLVRDFLLDRLSRDHPEDLPGLLCRAGQGEPDLARAVGNFAQAGAWDLAAAALADRGAALLAAGGDGVTRLLALLPAVVIAEHPDLAYLQGEVALLDGRPDAAFDAMARAAAAFSRAGRVAAAARASAHACLALQAAGRGPEAARRLDALQGLSLDDAARAVVAYGSARAACDGGRDDEVVHHVAAMVESLERVPDAAVWTRCARLAAIAGRPGVAPWLERFGDGSYRLAGEAPTLLRAHVLVARVALSVAAGRPDEARARLALADETCRWLGFPHGVAADLDRLRLALPGALADPRGALRRPAPTLSEREAEVLARIAAGDSNKGIARAFDLSPHTVKRHVANILGKLAVDTRGQAAAWWHAQS